VGDGEGEDEEREEERDERRHGEEVGGQEALPVLVGPMNPTSVTRRRSPPRTATGHRARRAHCALLGREPEARGDHRDGAEEGREVEARRDVVAHAHGVG
jgi:hypothetical protein